MTFEAIGIKVPTILLPKKDVDLKKWAVVACDQFTSEPEYWKAVEQLVGADPSTYNIIFPEAFLEAGDEEARITMINRTMQDYLDKGVLEEHEDCFIALDRKTSHVPSRKGLMVALDLEKYDFSEGSQTLIRATEGTIVERLPPRMKVRRDAPIELPHIMVLIDDPDKTVIEPLFAGDHEVVYDTDLMQRGGHITGYKITDQATLNNILLALETLADKDVFEQKYGVTNKGVLLFAMGDGNHSLATAKALWEELKKRGVAMNDPARYALVELVNLYDEGLEFEPIHRVLFGVSLDNFLTAFKEDAQQQGVIVEVADVAKEDVNRFYTEKVAGQHKLCFVSDNNYKGITLKNPVATIEAGSVQQFVNKYVEQHKEVSVDYIHGEDVTLELATKNNTGILIPSMSKHDLFKTVILEGALPRKTFSMGEAEEKRYYLECRKIK